jgi:hypothetical protein
MDNQLKKRACKSCVYAELVEMEEEGAEDFSTYACRRRSPTPIYQAEATDVPQRNADWPVVYACDWCGEFQGDVAWQASV